MNRWMSLEVFDGSFPAQRWAETHIDAIIAAALSHGVRDWNLSPTAWGVACEFAFDTKSAWSEFYNSEAMQRALSHVPNRDNVIVYHGRSLDGGTTSRLKPKPKSGADGAALPLPQSLRDACFDVALEALLSDASHDTRTSLVRSR